MKLNFIKKKSKPNHFSGVPIVPVPDDGTAYFAVAGPWKIRYKVNDSRIFVHGNSVSYKVLNLTSKALSCLIFFL